MLQFLYISIFACIVAADYSGDVPNYDLRQAEHLFEEFIARYGKVYPDAEEKRVRLEIFKENLKVINEKNAIGGTVFKIHRLCDISSEEFAQQYLGYKPNEGNHQCQVKHNVEVTREAPPSLNWVQLGAVTPVKAQGSCGSCWAFATIANIESQYILHKNDTKIFSEQELVDCSDNNGGCDGGNAGSAMSDIMHMGGVELKQDYPYEGHQFYEKNCRFNQKKVAANIAGCTVYYLSDEEDLKHLLAQRGPLAVSLRGTPLHHYFDKKDIVTKDHCPDSAPEKELGLHAVLLVGYGTDEKGTDFWLLKNSWGTQFSDGGYFRMTRGENTCGILQVTVTDKEVLIQMDATIAQF